MEEKETGRCHNLPRGGVLTILGSICIVFCMGNGYTFGNFNPYITSYLRNRSASTDVAYADSVWISTSNTIVYGLTMPVLTLLERRLSARGCIIVGGIIYSISVASTYFSINYSYITVAASYGAIGAGKALAYPITTKLAFRWFPNRKGLICGILEGGYGGSGFILNQIVTGFINPENLSPDQEVGDNEYFTQAILLDKVPYTYLLLGGMYTVVFAIGILLMREPPDGSTQQMSVQYNNDDEGGGTVAVSTISQKDMSAGVNNKLEPTSQTPTPSPDMTPREVLRSWIFYAVWLTYFFEGFAVDVNFFFYKTYGETFIDDDYFLALVASFGSVSVVAGNLFWGVLADKYTYKPVLMIVTCVFGVFTSTFCITEYGGKPMYFIWVCAIHFAFTGPLTILPLIAMETFGSKHFSINYGLLNTTAVAFSFFMAFFSSHVKDTIGWHGIYLLGAGFLVISFAFSSVVFFKKFRRLQ
ncbi:apicoplast pyruvate carrier 1-like [Haliotis cracherodii]|uniref:apicoplast pyruvate carrier 1-like n=1 Tax=Haliotis cracherodii TaxID=6455 RepID=UPI0039EA3359